jgi:hypothetical protein
MFKCLFLILLAVFFSAPASWAKSDVIKAYTFNLGNHTEFYNAVQKDDSGGIRKMAFAPTLGVGLNMPLIYKNFLLLPEFNWVLPKTSDDSHIIKNVFMLRTDLGYEALNWLTLRAGTGLMFSNIHGRGGKAKMNNGGGQSTFYYPSENRTSINNTFDLGIEGRWENYSLRLQTYTYSLFKEEQRQISYTLFLTYHWEQWKK